MGSRTDLYRHVVYSGVYVESIEHQFVQTNGAAHAENSRISHVETLFPIYRLDGTQFKEEYRVDKQSFSRLVELLIYVRYFRYIESCLY